MAEAIRKEMPAPHDFRDHKAHMTWQTDRGNYTGSNVPLIPQDMSQGSAASLSASSLQKALANPFIPLGMLATVGCLVGMLASTLNRNPNRAQLFMRGRVVAQGLTVAALVGGAMFFGIGGAHAPGPSIRTGLTADPSSSHSNSA